MSNLFIIKISLCFLIIIIVGCIPALSAQSLAESDHPYSNDIDKKWNISEPGASEIRLHFKDLQLAKSEELPYYDELLILDRYGNVVETYGGISGFSQQDFWTNWHKGDELTVELSTDKKRSCYGFIVDKKDFKIDENSSVESNSLAESDHPYSNDIDKKWNISEPGASEIRLHFKDLQLAKSEELPYYDELLILDRYGNVVENYGRISGFSQQDFWTNWYKGDELTVELSTDKKRPCYGFIVDKKDFKTDESIITSVSQNTETTETQSSSASDTDIGNIKSSNEDSSNEKSVNEKQTNTESSQTDKEPIWENPIFSSIVATVIGGLIVNNCPPLKDKIRSFMSKFRK